ncbi:hypothetical protein QL285_026524 [Trifolium repens]|nr:hypothetical protein QL285_026524 [Trifolium repens]
MGHTSTDKFQIKIPQLPCFDGKTDPLEHLMAVGTQTSIIGAEEQLKCKLLSSTFKDAALRWYMNLPNNSITSYADFHRKFIHQFTGSKHIQVTATNMFSLRQGNSETLREYLARFSEATIKVSNPNQEMFVAAFHNGLKAGNFNESMAQKPAEVMQEVMKQAECYIKGEESNAEKRSRDSRERTTDFRGNITPERNQRRWPTRDSRWQSRQERPQYPPRHNDRPSRRYEEYSPLNDTRVHILDEMLHTNLATWPQEPEHRITLGPNVNEWCLYHRCKWHDTERCYKLRDLIEELICSGHLRKFIEKAAQRNKERYDTTKAPRSSETEGDKGNDRGRIAVNTIAGGFAGGGESSSARKRDLRRAGREAHLINHVAFPPAPDLSF